MDGQGIVWWKTRPKSAKTNSTLKRKLWKSAFSEGVRHFERQFQVDGDVARNRSMDRWIGEWCSYNFAAGSFHTKKFCSRLFSTEVEFYWHKQWYRVFVPPFGGLKGNVPGLSMARWKARGRLPISVNWTFFDSYHGWGAMSRYWSKLRCLKWGWVTLNANFRAKGRPPPTNFGIRKLWAIVRWKKVPKISTAWVGCTNVTDRQTDRRQTDLR